MFWLRLLQYSDHMLHMSFFSFAHNLNIFTLQEPLFPSSLDLIVKWLNSLEASLLSDVPRIPVTLSLTSGRYRQALAGWHCHPSVNLPSYISKDCSRLIPSFHMIYLLWNLPRNFYVDLLLDNPTSNLLALVTVVSVLRQGWDVLYWIVIILYRCCNKLSLRDKFSM